MGDPQGISVTVEDIYGWALRNAYVSGGGGGCITEPNGCYFYTQSGSFTITATHTGYIEESQYVYVEPGHSEDYDFDVASGHAMYPSIMGVVHDESGDPLPDIFVWGQGIVGNTKCWGCFTNSDGNYSLPIHSAGDYIIYCGKNNYNIISHGNYSQSTAYPTSTTTINFTGGYSAERVDTTSSKLATYNRSVMIPDHFSSDYYYEPVISDEPNTNTVYAKTRTLTGTYLNTNINMTSDEIVSDGYGGSKYE